jgi:NIPSNAP
MPKRRALTAFALVAIFAATFFAARHAQSIPANVTMKYRLFEIRTYTTEKGKLPDLLKRFRDHTTKLFEKHGMTNIGYWTPTDEPRSQNTLIYILAHDSREAAKKSWDAFQHDPDWIEVKKTSEAAGKLVIKVESVYAEATDFSPLK